VSSLRLDTTVYDIATRLGVKLSRIMDGEYDIKALGHHVEIRSPKGDAYVDLYPRGRYILMRVSGSKEALKLIYDRPAKLEDGTTRYLIIIPGVPFKIPEDSERLGRLSVFGYVKYKGEYYLVTAHRSHILLAREAIEKHIKELWDDSVFYGMLDTSGRTPSFTIRNFGRRHELIDMAREKFGIEPKGCLESGGAGTVASILLGYSHAHILKVDRNTLLQRIVDKGKIRTQKKRE